MWGFLLKLLDLTNMNRACVQELTTNAPDKFSDEKLGNIAGCSAEDTFVCSRIKQDSKVTEFLTRESQLPFLEQNDHVKSSVAERRVSLERREGTLNIAELEEKIRICGQDLSEWRATEMRLKFWLAQMKREFCTETKCLRLLVDNHDKLENEIKTLEQKRYCCDIASKDLR